jgi:hypothetical protein
MRAKLLWIHENGRDYRRAVLFGAHDQRGVTGVQSSHGRNEAEDAAFRASLACGLFHPGDGSDGFHDGGAGKMPALRFGGDRALAIEMHQVGENGIGAMLPKQRRDLAAMVSAVIHQVLHGLPERVAIDAKF